jgi:hypothetical protein
MIVPALSKSYGKPRRLFRPSGFGRLFKFFAGAAKPWGREVLGHPSSVMYFVMYLTKLKVRPPDPLKFDKTAGWLQHPGGRWH